MGCLNKSAGGKAGYLVLNAIRILNIITLLAIIGANMAFLIKTIRVKDSTLQLFDGAQRALVILIVCFLLATEMPKVFSGYFSRHWPAFSYQSGFLALGFAFLVLGCNVLSDLNKTTSTQENMGKHSYKMVLAAGAMAIGMSSINVIASVLLADRAKGLTARQVRGFKVTLSNQPMA